MRRYLRYAIIPVLIGAGALVYFFWPQPKYNLVLVSIDTLRPDHLGSYGYGRDTSPELDRLAREGVRFQDAVSSTSWTLPAHMALMTSLPDPVHGVLWDDNRLDPNRTTLAELMKANGYRTGGIFTGPYLLPQFGFDQGFDDYIDCTLYDKKLKGMDVLVASERGRTTPGALDRAEKWLDQKPGKPFFLFLHLFDVHPDFDPPEPFHTMFDPDYQGKVTGKDVFHDPNIRPDMDPRDLDHLQALYDGEIRYVDTEGIKRLVEILKKRNLLERTLIVITSDHGEEFFEHGEFGHRKNLYDTTLRIPLIFRCPKLVPGDKIVSGQVRIIDIMPTILELLKIPQGSEELGSSLAPLWRKPGAAKAERNNFAELTSSSNNLHLESLRADGSKIVIDFLKNQGAWFDLKNDPGELHPVSDQNSAAFQTALKLFNRDRLVLRKCLEAIPWGKQEKLNLDPTTRDRLKSLGYTK